MMAIRRCLTRSRSNEHIWCFARKRKTQFLVTVIEIRPFRNGWKCFEAPGLEPVFLDQAIDYAKSRACFRSGEIRVLNCDGAVQRSIPFSETDMVSLFQ